MKSIKPGRGPSAMGFMGSVISIVFGIFWTVMAATITQGVPVIGIFFPLFGVLFIIMGIINAVYNYKNATSKNRFSILDITDSTEESDPLQELIKKETNPSNSENINNFSTSNINFCPYCGAAIDENHKFCSKCGKELS